MLAEKFGTQDSKIDLTPSGHLTVFGVSTTYAPSWYNGLTKKV
jgi:hypothetical protein